MIKCDACDHDLNDHVEEPCRGVSVARFCDCKAFAVSAIIRTRLDLVDLKTQVLFELERIRALSLMNKKLCGACNGEGKIGGGSLGRRDCHCIDDDSVIY